MQDPSGSAVSRRFLLKGAAATAAVAAATAPPATGQASPATAAEAPSALALLSLTINERPVTVAIDPRTSLLDTLREHLALTGAKKGCDHGQCGACTVHVDGRRILSCLTLALTVQDRKVTTIEGLSRSDGSLHPMQAAFIEHDAFQCGYCTPGQIMSAVACVQEGHAESDESIREHMSGNLCRCAAYPNIVAAIKQATTSMKG